ncbi:hypothetical protein K7G98_39195, partial [Saccharothrix sp. MB29]|nr:hypothetical protein [Saccharothrix sp. MB29]
RRQIQICVSALRANLTSIGRGEAIVTRPPGYLLRVADGESDVQLFAALTAEGIPASVSHTAGTFVCNHVFYGLMHLTATAHPGTRAGFVHVPFS